MADKILPLSQHLNEIRRRIAFCLVSVFIGSVVSYIQRDWLLDILTAPVGRLVFIAPQEAFIVILKLSLLGGIVLSSPLILYQVYKFIWIALYREEKNLFIAYGASSFLLFLGGVLFSSYLMLPVVTRFLLSFQGSNLAPMISIDKYVSYFIFLIITFSVIFESPLIMIFMTRLGIINPFELSHKRKFIVLAAFIVGAVLTPPDIFTQLLMAIPLLAVFEIGLVSSKLAKRRMERRS